MVDLINSNHGGEVLVGGGNESVDIEQKYIAPHVICHPNIDSELFQNEIFGPILLVNKVDSVAQAMNVVLDKPHSLALYVFAKDQNVIGNFIYMCIFILTITITIPTIITRHHNPIHKYNYKYYHNHNYNYNQI